MIAYKRGDFLSKNKRKNNVIKFTRKPDINIGLVLFIIIFIYILISVFIYLFSKKTIIYEVNAGSLAFDTTYKGFIMREEQTIKSPYSGNINFFIGNNEKISIGNVVYSVDETGRVYEKIKENSEKDLNKDEIAEIKDMLTNFSMNYSSNDFGYVYDTGESIINSIYEFQSNNIAGNLDEYISDTQSMDFFHPIKAEKTGIVSYIIDGYETADETILTDTLFENTDYKFSNLLSLQLINKGESAYRLVTSDVWYIYVQLDSTQAMELADSTTVNITFVDSDIKCSADFSQVTSNGKTYGKIKLTKYMINFINDRYVRINLTEQNEQGLKIPVTSVFNKSFYTIPKEYLTPSNTFIRKYYDENGQVKTEAIEANIYDSDEKYYFVSMDDFKSGDILMIPDSDQTYIVGTMDELTGVYCVNKGYAVFRKVNILEQNAEYCIVEKGSNYGLSIYDHIALDYKTIRENEILN